MIRASATAAANRSGVVEKPGASSMTTEGIMISKTTTTTSNTKRRTACTSPARRSAAAPPFSLASRAKLGTKALLNAPSALSRRNMLGSFSATRKASAAGPAPRKAAKTISRKRPRIRLAVVSTPIWPKDRASDEVIKMPPHSPCRKPPAIFP